MNQQSFLADYPPFDPLELTHRFGTPLFLFFPDVFRRNAEQLRQPLKSLYPAYLLAYSVKTNHLAFVVKRAIDHGLALEIISGLELALLERFGFLNANTVVNGPTKTESELARALSHGCKINVDNLTELGTLERLAARIGRTVGIGLRVRGEVGDLRPSRFGFSAQNGEADAVAERISRSMPHLRVQGLHLHGRTDITDTCTYAMMSALVADLAHRLAQRGLIALEYLDLGGGFATGCPVNGRAEWVVPTAADYVSAIAAPILSRFECPPTLVLEPGRYFIDDAFLLLTRVEGFQGTDEQQLVVDAGINILPHARFRQHRFLNLTRPTGLETEYSVFGPLCLEADCLSRGTPIAEVQPGDLLCVDYAGAYSFSQSWTFIRLQPAVVAVEEGGWFPVRRRETIDDFLARDLRDPGPSVKRPSTERGGSG